MIIEKLFLFSSLNFADHSAKYLEEQMVLIPEFSISLAREEPVSRGLFLLSYLVRISDSAAAIEL